MTRVSDAAAERKARGLLVDRMIDAMNHPDSLATFRAITGEPAIRLVNGQATRYLPGHFLTSHDDGIDGQDRVAAYVINLTQGWRTDWGGLLQFHNPGGDIPLALKPGFNTIHLFRVPQVHSVSYVAPFAGVPRYAIMGGCGDRGAQILPGPGRWRAEGVTEGPHLSTGAAQEEMWDPSVASRHLPVPGRIDSDLTLTALVTPRDVQTGPARADRGAAGCDGGSR